ncbi:histidine phosphatase family protein [Gordonia sp. (in: high G+C Gram-positive bacteria)]|uniref:histidine phosphatase family protein n=1 Tax=Gordonia sp. (in: high G+C Gram-positive bacteria) TaxID=84139 RepID=UPI0039E5E7C6
MTVVYLCRHGETALNADGRLRGLADPDLDAVGRRQADALAGALADSGTGLVVSSPLARARQTATLIAGALGVAPEVDDGFNDRDYGEWTGQVKSEVIARFGSVDAAPGVEASADVLARARPTLDKWADRADARGCPVAVVTHDAVIRPLLVQFGVADDDLTVRTASYQILDRTDGAWTVRELDILPD